MGLLSALNLPRPKTWPPLAAATPPAKAARPAAVARRAEVVAAGDADGADDDDAGAVADLQVLPERGDVEAAPEGATDDAPAIEDEDGAAASVAAGSDGDKADPPLTIPPQGIEVGYGDFSFGVKDSNDGTSIVVKWEKKQNIARENFKVWVIPCYFKADLKVGVAGELVLRGKGDRSLALSAGGSLELGIGTSTDKVTAGPYGMVELTASTSVPTRLSEAREISTDGCTVNIYGSGKIGIKFEIEDSWSANTDCELANWHLFVLKLGGYVDGKFSSFSIAPGKDVQRMISALQRIGPVLADAVDKYAPKAVKQAAEDGAKWVAESPEAKEIADDTKVVLDKVEKTTGIDVGGGVEEIVQTLVDPDGETGAEFDARFKKEMEEFSAAHDEFNEVIARSGLKTEFNNTLYRSADDFNQIYEVFRAGGEWRPMVEALVAKCRAKRDAWLKQQEEKKRREKAEAEAAAAAELARRVAAAEARMNAAEQAANGPGNFLNNTAAQGSKKRDYWTQGMKFRDPATLRKMQVGSLQGEARIAKADEATGLFLKAKAVFEQGAHVTD